MNFVSLEDVFTIGFYLSSLCFISVKLFPSMLNT